MEDYRDIREEVWPGIVDMGPDKQLEAEPDFWRMRSSKIGTKGSSDKYINRDENLLLYYVHILQVSYDAG